MKFPIEKRAMLLMKSGKRLQPEEWNCQIKTRFKRSEKRKPTNT